MSACAYHQRQPFTSQPLVIDVGTVELDSACLAKLPQTEQSPAAPKTLAQWQAMLPNTWINIDKLIFSPWQEWQGKLSLALTSDIQQLRYQGEKVKFQGQLKGQQLTVSNWMSPRLKISRR